MSNFLHISSKLKLVLSLSFSLHFSHCLTFFSSTICHWLKVAEVDIFLIWHSSNCVLLKVLCLYFNTNKSNHNYSTYFQKSPLKEIWIKTVSVDLTNPSTCIISHWKYFHPITTLPHTTSQKIEIGRTRMSIICIKNS